VDDPVHPAGEYRGSAWDGRGYIEAFEESEIIGERGMSRKSIAKRIADVG
jgi:hypothetical protein